jgi:type IV secretion system protein VirB10
MNFMEQLKRKMTRRPREADPATEADEVEQDGPQEAADRELPSVNARRNNQKLTGWAAMIFIGAMTLYLIYQMNTGTDRKEAAALKRDQEIAKANQVTSTLPAITIPQKPILPPMEGQQANAAGPADQVPAPDGAPPLPPSAMAPPANSAQGQPQVKPELSPWEKMRLRRRTGVLVASFDGQGAEAGAGANATGAGGADAGAGAGIDATQAAILAAALGRQGGGVQSAPTPNTPAASSPAPTDELGKSLQPTITRGTMATKLPDRNYLIAKGAFMDCALETRIDSTRSGMTSCTLTTNMYSENGKVILLERGSKMTGQYQGGLKQGEARIFVLWTRVQTPKGVIINLDSPGTDALGGSGLDGYVDTHFWQRFGGAIMLSLIDDAFLAAAQRNNSGGTTVNLGNTSAASQSMAAEALKNSINIPPTLMKNHGDHINVFVARDLDFRSVYGIRAQ